MTLEKQHFLKYFETPGSNYSIKMDLAPPVPPARSPARRQLSDLSNVLAEMEARSTAQREQSQSTKSKALFAVEQKWRERETDSCESTRMARWPW